MQTFYTINEFLKQIFIWKIKNFRRVALISFFHTHNKNWQIINLWKSPLISSWEPKFSRTSLWSEEIVNNSFFLLIFLFSFSLWLTNVLDLIIIHIAVYIVALTINFALVLHLNNWKQWNAPKAKKKQEHYEMFPPFCCCSRSLSMEGKKLIGLI